MLRSLQEQLSEYLLDAADVTESSVRLKQLAILPRLLVPLADDVTGNPHEPLLL